jgi:hypothetical protein
MRVSLIALALLAFAPGSYSEITDCSKGTSYFKVNALGFWPDPPVKGENSTISFDYTVPDGPAIDKGTAKYSVTYNFIPISPTTEDLCLSTTCPILPGTYNQSTSSTFPTGLTGTVITKIQWFDVNSKELFCAQIKVKV